MGDMDQIEQLPEAVITHHGSVDLVFNNAVTVAQRLKVFSNRLGLGHEHQSQWRCKISRAFLPYLKERPESVLVNTSSIFGMIAVVGQSVYHATKFGVHGFTESLQKNLKIPPQIHCVHPGHVGTNIVANSRFNEDDASRLGPDFDRDRMAEMFKARMHPSRAAEIILSGVKKKKEGSSLAQTPY